MTKTDAYVRVCPHCIETIPSTAKVCKFCGANLDDGTTKPVQPQMNLATASISAVGCVGALALVLFLALVMLFAVLQFSASR